MTGILGTVLLAACELPNDPKLIVLDEPFQTRIGQYHVTADRDLTFKVSEVVEDSRGLCQARGNKACVWDGEIIVKLEYSFASQSGSKNYQDIRYHEKIGPYKFSIDQVRPSKSISIPSRYRFTMTVKRDLE